MAIQLSLFGININFKVVNPMKKFKSYRELISTIHDISQKLDDGTIQENEIKECSDLVKQLYDRLIILQYKTEEEKVFSKKNTQPTKTEKSESKKKEDFYTIQFDFDPVGASNETKIDTKIDATLTNDQNSVETQTEIATEESTSSKEDNNQPNQIEDSILKKNVEDGEEDETPDNQSTEKYYELFVSWQKDAKNDPLSNTKIESIAGSLGLNDKIRVINDLFHSDKSLFQSTIEQIESVNSGDEARKILSEIAVKNNWEKVDDFDLIEEFARLVNRKFA